MTETLDSLVRQLGPRDHLRFPEVERISASVAALNEQPAQSATSFLASLGADADQITLARRIDDGRFFYEHFGVALAQEAGFDMTGKSTADFELETRKHIESSFQESLARKTSLTTIMPGSPGSSVASWQRIVFPVSLEAGDYVISLVKPLRDGTEIIHARPPKVCICVVPLEKKDGQSSYQIGTREPLEAYLLGAELAVFDAFVASIAVPQEGCEAGSLLAARTVDIETPSGVHLSLVADIVFGRTAPYLVVANVTGSKQTHDDLRSTSHLLKASFEVGRLGSWINSDRTGARLILAPEVAALFGVDLDRNGFIAMDELRTLYEPALREASIERVKACWETGESYVNEGRVNRPDGSWIYVRISGSPMRDQTGKIISLFGLVQDITSEYRTNLALQESEERFRDFASTAGDWCWETDEEHRFVDFTEGVDRASYDQYNMYIGKTRRDMDLMDEDRPLIEAHFEDLDAHRPFTDLVYRLQFDKEDIRSIQISGKPRFDADGRFLGYRGTARNITQSVAADNERLENQLAIESAQSIAKLGHWITDLKTNNTRWSQGLMGLVGFPLSQNSDDDVDRPWWHSLLERVHRTERRSLVRRLRQAASGADVEPFDIRYFADDAAQAQHLRIMLRRKAATTTQSAQLMGVAQDVTALKRAREELEKRSATLLEAQAMGGIGDWQFDCASGEVSWSRNLYALLGLDPEHYVPTAKAVFSLCGPEDCAAIQAEHAAALQGKPASSIDVQARRGDGTFGYYTMMTKTLLDEQGQICGLFGTVQDITERKHAEKQLRELAFFDPLTGLANRALFTRELNDVLHGVRVNGGSAALFLLDLDHFKEVNDSLGHAAGDELLRKVAQTLKNNTAEKVFVARLGGDEFAIIIRNYSSVDCLERYANTTIEKLSGMLQLERGEVQVGTSLGIALIPQDGGNTEEALRNADMALYMAKDEGRGRALFFTPMMSRAVQARLNMTRDLRIAIENNHLETRFQGQVDLKSGRVAGFETLVRWKHPIRGYVSPAEFIPVAESSSLICEIGLWVLRDACKTGRAWLDAGEPERMISVNVSAAQIWQSDFEDDVLSIVADTGYPPHLLCLELTESVFADHGEGRVRRALSRFKAAGIRLAVDDFGTGYSSLGYLNDLPFDELKIDRCFIAGIHQAPDKARLLQGIIALGRGLGMKVVGEGAEEDAEIALLRAYGCDLVQGFAYMRPEKADDALRCAEELEFQIAEQTDKLAIVENPLKKAG
ncbi:MAG: EAL domain-containing protein [Devosiaceae bacterium]